MPEEDRRLLVRLRREARVFQQPGGEALLVAPWTAVGFGRAGPGVITALQALTGSGAHEDALADLALQDGRLALPYLLYGLQRAKDEALLCYLLSAGNGAAATIVPVVRGFTPTWEDAVPGARFRLSRLALLQRDAEGDGDDPNALVLSSPAAPVRVTLPPALAGAVLSRLGRADNTLSADDLPPATAGLLGLLAQTGLIEAVDEHDAPLVTEPLPLAQWQFHDLLLHQHSRSMRRGGLAGAASPFQDKVEPLPALAPDLAEAVVPLYQPDIAALAAIDVPLTAVLERRASVRAYAAAPIRVEQLGEFLFRTARVRALVPRDPAVPHSYEASSRPYPGGGAIHNIEIYAVVRACAGLAPGLYHYRPLEHALGRLPAQQAHLEALWRDALRAAPLSSPPQVLLVLTARFPRMSWKYVGIAYNVTLKNTGVLYQTMYLVATAMGLAPCALGGGDSDAFALAAGLDPLVESSVGEFLLGSAPRQLTPI